MKQCKVLTYQRQVVCPHCKVDYSANFQAPDEGFGHAAQLYQCSNCQHPYYHSIEEAKYLGPLAEKIKGVLCVKCSEPLSNSLQKVKFIGSCPNCRGREYQSSGKASESFILVTGIYQE